MEFNAELNEILKAVENSDYPDDFTDEYVFIECLSQHSGIETFVVQDKNGEKYIAKCFERSLWEFADSEKLLDELDHGGLPKYISFFQNENYFVTVREYIEGTSLDRYSKENDLSEKEITDILVKLCDILSYLHNRPEPIIHRDIKPSNVIIGENGEVTLIDFDIARVFIDEDDYDTIFFGTRIYAPPEQYGFSQTDARTDIYSLGILMRFLLTGSVKDNKNIRIYKPLAKIIKKCTAFAPKERFSNVEQVKRALLKANPKSQVLRKFLISACAVLIAAAIAFGVWGICELVNYRSFSERDIPIYLSDEERVSDAVKYLKNKYKTDIFDNTKELATMGTLRKSLIELYKLDRDYVYGSTKGVPAETKEYFMGWPYGDEQYLLRDIAVYAAVKVHDPDIVKDWSSIKEDNGIYPGVRVAVDFAEKNKILSGVNNPTTLFKGDLAVILANSDRYFSSKSKST